MYTCVCVWCTSWDTATPYVAIQYRSNIDHFRVAPVGGQSRRFGALCGTRDAYSANRTGPCPPSAFFHTMRKKENRRRNASLEDLMDHLSGERVDCYPVGGREEGRERISDLARYDYIDLVFATRKDPRRVWNSNRSTSCSRLCTHVYVRVSDLCVLPLEFIGSRWAKFGEGKKKEIVYEEKRGGGRLREKVRKS